MFIAIIDSQFTILRVFDPQDIEDALDYVDALNADMDLTGKVYYCAKVKPFERNEDNIYDDNEEEEININFGDMQ